MSPMSLALLIFGVMLVLMVVRVPIAGAMFVAGTVGMILQADLKTFLSFTNNVAYTRLASYDLSVIPLFILMGHFATQGGISKALFGFAAAVMAASRADWPWGRCWPARPLAPSAARRWPRPPPSRKWPCPR